MALTPPRSRALVQVVEALAQAGKYEQAETLARSITDLVRRQMPWPGWGFWGDLDPCGRCLRHGTSLSSCVFAGERADEHSSLGSRAKTRTWNLPVNRRSVPAGAICCRR